jgi:hypothetical protein
MLGFPDKAPRSIDHQPRPLYRISPAFVAAIACLDFLRANRGANHFSSAQFSRHRSGPCPQKSRDRRRVCFGFPSIQFLEPRFHQQTAEQAGAGDRSLLTPCRRSSWKNDDKSTQIAHVPADSAFNGSFLCCEKRVAVRQQMTVSRPSFSVFYLTGIPGIPSLFRS